MRKRKRRNQSEKQNEEDVEFRVNMDALPLIFQFLFLSGLILKAQYNLESYIGDEIAFVFRPS